MCKRRNNKKILSMVEQSVAFYHDEELNIRNMVRDREKHITDLVAHIVNHNEKRLKAKVFFQYFITFCLLFLILGFGVLTAFVVIQAAKGKVENLGIVVAILSSTSASFIASILTILYVITKYIFPSEEDKNSNNVLNTVLSSDLSYLDFYYKNEISKSKGFGTSDQSE